jgi:hypothetical protein
LPYIIAINDQELIVINKKKNYSACKLDHSILFVDCDKSQKNLKSGPLSARKHKTKESKKNALETLMETLGLDMTFAEQILTPNGGLVLKPSKKFMKHMDKYANYAIGLNNIANSNNKSSNESENMNTTLQKASNYYYILNDNANLGW